MPSCIGESHFSDSSASDIRRMGEGVALGTTGVGVPTGRAGDYRCLTTCICRQHSRTGHVKHFGSRPVQMCFPNGTSRRLISIQYFRGSFSSSARIVPSGDEAKM